MARARWPVDAGGGRGLLLFGRFTDSYGADVRVQSSSSAEEPHVWVFIQGGGTHAPDSPRGRANDGAAHLTRKQATSLRDAIDKWPWYAPSRAKRARARRARPSSR